ncbi:integrase [Bacillus pseudomycoides]|nr:MULTISPECIES: site-specific integrase [Bacillus cereus group]PEP12644.1 integrase [Bacillus wiedmannii]PFY94643.1 integrase [Bacillus pseudomycoides]PGB77790.1 integrase [Bacillus pseudomycoides]PGC36472.1 integrase [Bacillus pseudomycoides]PHB09976.1 integrase [Bacillus wiedmannii]
MITLTISTRIPQSPFYEKLLGKVDEQLLHFCDARDVFLLDKMDERYLKYYINKMVDKPWNNHLFLALLVFKERNLNVETIVTMIQHINSRLRDLFIYFNLTDWEEYDVETHMYQYFKGSILKQHSDIARAEFLTRYRTCSYTTKKWVLTKIPNEQQEYFHRFVFPMPTYDSREFSFTKAAKEQAQNTRKSETDAIVPFLPQIRAEGHFRWNQITRLRQTYLKVCEQAKTPNVVLPLDFYYDEPERVGERFYFRLWDKPSFVLSHKEQFNASTLKAALNRKGVYSEENNHYFVEFIKAERLEDDEEAEGLWFIELFENNLIGQWFQNLNDNELKHKRDLLFLWGYGRDNSNSNPEPFNSKHKGILTSSTFVSLHKDKTEGILFDVEPIYAAATFGLLALDICTTTGTRINELLQISNTKECIRTVKVDKKLRFSFYAIPKGRDELEAFYISEQTIKIIQSVGLMLRNHYGTDKIPSVKYRGVRKHLFPKPKPYFFQYHNKALGEFGVWSSLRFLLHGQHMETQEGKPVVVKTHLLRHAFATEAVQRQKLPIDIVAKILHQRDVGVTGYYSEPTPSQVAQSVSDLHDVTSDYIDIDEAVLRNPEELEKELEEYKEKVGVFNNVIGGTCVTDHVCPIKMACLGCQAKIPQPEKKHEVLEVIELSKDMEKRYSAMNLTVEVKKAKAMRKHARNELKEIELIEKYREEQKYEPDIQFKK